MDSTQHSPVIDRGLITQGTASSEPGQTQGGAASTMRAAVISLGGEIFTIDLKSVREVFVIESITPVPGMPPGLVGVTNLRGTVIPLLDLRSMFALNSDAPLRYAVVLKHEKWQVGILVDRVPEIRTLSKEQFMPAPAGTGERVFPIVSTVVKLEDRFRGLLEASVVLSHFEGIN